MSFGILLVSHPGIAPAILQNAQRIWPGEAPVTDVLEVPFDADTDNLQILLEDKLNSLDSGNGVVVLCDIAGASPCNLLSKARHERLCRISGLNLPMLLRAYNYQHKSLDQISELLIEGGCRSICLIT